MSWGFDLVPWVCVFAAAPAGTLTAPERLRPEKSIDGLEGARRKSVEIVKLLNRCHRDL